MNKSNNYLFHNKSLYWFYKLFFFAFTGFIGQANKIKQKIKTSGDQNAGRGDNGGKLGDVMEAGRPVLLGLEVILQILRLGGHFCGDYGAFAPPRSQDRTLNI